MDIKTFSILEAEKIVNIPLRSYQDMQKAAHALLNLNINSVLLTGGHFEDQKFSQDYWTNGQESFWIAARRLPEKNYPTTGTTLSEAINAHLAEGYSLQDAIVIAKMHRSCALRGGSQIDQVDLPYASSEPLFDLPKPFKRCDLGLYPVVDSSHWIEKLLLQGVKCIQLRIKNKHQPTLEHEIEQSVALAKKFGATLFINDYWELAIRYGADGIHLGQEDLLTADLAQIRQSGLYLGVSTHCYYEVARAHAVNPSYIACGPIYATTSKDMSFQPQGVEQLKHWRRMLNYPLVAIGGINLERLPDVLQSGVAGVALISAITEAHDPLEATQQFLKIMSKH